MAHLQQLSFVEVCVKHLKSQDLSIQKVLEIGSYDINGTVRQFFDNSISYLGLDLVEGPGVDIVYDGRNIESTDLFDIVLCCEVFEHDPYWHETFQNMIRLTRPGGAIIFTCASTGRPEHGTIRTNPNGSPGTQSLGLDYYKNLEASEFKNRFELDEIFSEFLFMKHKSIYDLYFIGIKRDHTRKIQHTPHLTTIAKETKALISSRERLYYKKMDPKRRLIRFISRLDPARYIILKTCTDTVLQEYLIFRRKLWKIFFHHDNEAKF